MYHRPFPHKAQSTARYFTLNNVQAIDIDCGLELTVAGMKMRRRVIIEKDPD
jgi:hypothetical protein